MTEQEYWQARLAELEAQRLSDQLLVAITNAVVINSGASQTALRESQINVIFDTRDAILKRHHEQVR